MCFLGKFVKFSSLSNFGQLQFSVVGLHSFFASIFKLAKAPSSDLSNEMECRKQEYLVFLDRDQFSRLLNQQGRLRSAF